MQFTREEQEAFELQHDEEAVAARLTEIAESLRGGGLDLPKTQRFISRAYSLVAEVLQRQMDTVTRGHHAKIKGWLRKVPADVGAVICLRTAISKCLLTMARRGTMLPQGMMAEIGRQFELEVRIREAETVNPVYMQKVTEQIKDRGTTNARHIRNVMNVAYSRIMDGEFDSHITETEAVHLGNYGLEALIEAGIVQVNRQDSRRGTLLTVELSPEVLEFLTEYSRDDMQGVLDSGSMFMFCPPDPWTNAFDGGFISDRRRYQNPLLPLRKKGRRSERGRLSRLYTAENMPIVFQAVNYLQSIPFTVHAPTLNAMLQCWRSGGAVMGVPERNFRERPEFPFSESWVKADAPQEEQEAFVAWKREVVRWYEERKAWASRVREVARFLKLADSLQAQVWFPVHLDTRGRVYYRGTPNPQGTDLAKSALHFSERKPLGRRGLYWLRVHIANSFGYDKERLDKRAQWTVDNWSAIERALDAPADYPDVWGTDAPWCMFSAAWELREALRSGNPEGYCTGIPIHMDATCSGLQHFSALLRDPAGAKYVNLVDADGVGPKQDIYSRVASTALMFMRNDLESDDAETRAMASLWIKHGISRNAAKKPVMTYVYGATVAGTVDWLYLHMVMTKEECEAAGAELNKTLAYGAKKLFSGIAQTVPAAADAMRWLQTLVGNAPDNKRLEWTVPTGFRVVHDYQDAMDKRIDVKSSCVKQLTIRSFGEGTDKHRMKNAISPNFVHAMDAAHLQLTAVAMQNAGLQMVGIHDSFGTHPCDVDSMHSLIRESFVKLYQNEEFLSDFLWEVGLVGETPRLGKLDLASVLDSEFFFS